MGVGTYVAGRKLIELATYHSASTVLGLREEPLSPGMETLYICLCIFLVILAGLMAGLTLGLMSLDRVDTEVIKRSGTPKEKWLVERIEPVLAHPHHLLVTLLLTNALAMEALPIFLDRLLNPVAAILISVTAILFFGEVIPQAVCKRYGLQVGAYLAWFVRALMFFTAPISYPIARILDWILGEETALFRRAELKALVSMHAEPTDEGGVSNLTQDEVNVIQGALDMATKTAETAMTPLGKVFMLSSEAVINDELLKQAIDKGHSRVPVYEGSKQNIIGLILIKELVLVDEDAGVKVKDLRLREIPFLRADIPMYDVLKIFRTGRSHMAVLTQRTHPTPNATPGDRTPQGGSPVSVRGSGGSFGGGGRGVVAGLRRSSTLGTEGGVKYMEDEEAIGIITIEDVLEELLQQEIVDETDRYVDNLQTVRTTTLLSLQHLPPNLRKFLTRSFRAGSPVNRAAFQAALAAQTPFSLLSAPPGGSDGGSLTPAGSVARSPEKQVAFAAAVAAAAAAASAATAAVDENPSLLAAGGVGAGQGGQLQHSPRQQQQQQRSPRQQQQQQPARLAGLLRGGAGTRRSPRWGDEEPLLRAVQGSSSSGVAGDSANPRPPLPQLRLQPDRGGGGGDAPAGSAAGTARRARGAPRLDGSSAGRGSC